MAKTGSIRVGVGGWTYAPWRNNFFPKGLPQHQELAHAARQLTAIEINGTYYRTQQRASFAKWRDETPAGFVFSAKASRYATNQRVLGDAGESVERFVNSGLAELGDKLGPLVWQFMPTKRFDPVDFGAFLKLLPKRVEGLPLRHVMDVRHESFRSPEYLALARAHKVATGYAAVALDRWAERGREWAAGAEPADLPRVEPVGPAGKPRDVFLYVISGAKERAPAAAVALLQRLGSPPSC